jgi:hypothetical protein
MYIITEDGKGGYVPVVEGFESGFNKERVFLMFSEKPLSARVLVGDSDLRHIEDIPEMDPAEYHQLTNVPGGSTLKVFEWEEK